MANKGRRMVFEEDIKRIGQGGGATYTAGTGIDIDTNNKISADIKEGTGINIVEELSDNSLEIGVDTNVVATNAAVAETYATQSALAGVNNSITYINSRIGEWIDNRTDVDPTAFTVTEDQTLTDPYIFDATNVFKDFILLKTPKTSTTFVEAYEAAGGTRVYDFEHTPFDINGASPASSAPVEFVLGGAVLLVDDTTDPTDVKFTILVTNTSQFELGRADLGSKPALKRFMKVGNNDFKIFNARPGKFYMGLGIYDPDNQYGGSRAINHLTAFGYTIDTANSIRGIGIAGTGTQDAASISCEFSKTPYAQIVLQAVFGYAANPGQALPNYQVAAVPTDNDGTYVLKATVTSGALTKIEWVLENNQ